MGLKMQHFKSVENVQRYNLNNSIVPAMQGWIIQKLQIGSLREQDMLSEGALSYANIFETLNQTCLHIKNWTKQIDQINFENCKSLLRTTTNNHVNNLQVLSDSYLDFSHGLLSSR